MMLDSSEIGAQSQFIGMKETLLHVRGKHYIHAIYRNSIGDHYFVELCPARILAKRFRFQPNGVAYHFGNEAYISNGNIIGEV